jgi:hypothetical protein
VDEGRLRRIGLVLVDLELADDAVERRPGLTLPNRRQIGALGDGAGVSLRKPPIGLVGRVAEDDRRLLRFTGPDRPRGQGPSWRPAGPHDEPAFRCRKDDRWCLRLCAVRLIALRSLVQPLEGVHVRHAWRSTRAS